MSFTLDLVTEIYLQSYRTRNRSIVFYRSPDMVKHTGIGEIWDFPEGYCHILVEKDTREVLLQIIPESSGVTYRSRREFANFLLANFSKEVDKIKDARTILSREANGYYNGGFYAR